MRMARRIGSFLLTAGWVVTLAAACSPGFVAAQQPHSGSPEPWSDPLPLSASPTAPAADGEPSDLTPPPPVPRSANRPTSAPASSAPKTTLKEPAPWKPVSSQPLSTTPAPKSEAAKPEGTSSSYISSGMISFPPAPAPTPPAPAPRPMPAARTGSTANSPYSVVPASARTTAPSSIWGWYKQRQTTAAPAPAPVRRDQPVQIQGFKPGPAPAAVAPQAAPANLTPAQLQQRVMAESGIPAQKVNVTSQNDGTLLVEVRVRSNQEADDVSSRVLPLPEMLSSGARLKIVVDPK
jgi:hypothetical protein